MGQRTAQRDKIAKQQGITVKGAQGTVTAAHAKREKRLAMGAPADRFMVSAASKVGNRRSPGDSGVAVTIVEPAGLWL